MDDELIEQSIRWLKAQSKSISLPRGNSEEFSVTAARPSSRDVHSHLLHQHPCRRRAGTRCAKASKPTCRRSRRRSRRLRRSGSACGCRRSRRKALSKPAALDELRALLAAWLLRLHHQCVSLRAVHGTRVKEGRLPARLACAGAAELQRPARAISSPRCCPTECRLGVERAGDLSRRSRRAPGRAARRWPTRWRGTPLISSRCSAYRA
jgi:hypothetical protein